MATAIEAINTRIGHLEDELVDCQTEIDVLEQKRAGYMLAIQELRSVIQDIHSPSNGLNGSSRPGKPKTPEIIVTGLRESDSALTTQEIYRFFEDSDGPPDEAERRLIRSTLFNLKKNGTVEHNKNKGTYKLVE